MSIKIKIKKDDTVKVIAGDDKGKVGKVLRVYPRKLLVTVKGVNLVKKHRKATQGTPGSIDTFEKPIHLSNVAFSDKTDKIITDKKGKNKEARPVKKKAKKVD